jgi:large subunit ribosomal protein L11
MAPKKNVAHLTIELTAGDAAVVELGKMLGPYGVNLVEIKKAYDGATASQRGDIVPAVITISEDRSFDLQLKTPPTSFLIRKAINGPGTARAGHAEAGSLSLEQLRAIAERKLPDLNTSDIEAAMRTVAGTARSMGVTIKD